VKCALLLSVGAATIAVAGLAGCSNNSKDDEDSSASPSPTTASSASPTPSSAAASNTASSGTGSPTVTVDGQPQNVSGPVVCSTTDGKFSIAIGDVITGVIVGLEPDASVVHNIGLGNVNGVVLSFTEGVPANTATATKDGNNYKIKGTATGTTEANPTEQISKPFEIDASCP
jgi:lipoprotein LpqH